MITIPAKQIPSTDDQGNATTILEPTSELPSNRIATVCDGTNYTVYEQGDTLPSASTGSD